MKVKQVFLFLWLVLLAACAESNDKSPQTKTQELVKEDTLTSFLDSSWEQIEGTPVWIRKDIFDHEMFNRDSMGSFRHEDGGILSYYKYGKGAWYLGVKYEDYSKDSQMKFGYWFNTSSEAERQKFEIKYVGNSNRLSYSSMVFEHNFLEYRAVLVPQQFIAQSSYVAYTYRVESYFNKVIRISYNHHYEHKNQISFKEHDYVLSCVRIKWY